MDYALVRDVHIGCATFSILLFGLRGAMQMAVWPWRKNAWLRIVPHVNDTLLLSAAITLAAMSHQYPWAQPWLAAKVLALLAYIGLGKVALGAKTSPAMQRTAFTLAMLTVAYIVGVAITRSATLDQF